MTISFDLDDLLICHDKGVPCEPCALSWLAGEPLRLGARALFTALRADGHRVGVYTTSYRPAWRIRLWLRCHGLRADFVLTQRDNDLHSIVGKRPRAFGIDLHIDDASTPGGVQIAPEDTAWTSTIADAARTVPRD